MVLSSRLPLHRIGSPQERLKTLIDDGWLDPASAEAAEALTPDDWLGLLDGNVENVVAAYPMPLSAATNFVVNGRETLAPMVTEERTVVAAASKAAKLCRPKGFSVKVRPPIAVAQLLYPRPRADGGPFDELARVKRMAAPIVDLLRRDDRMVRRGGGPISLDARLAESDRGPMLIVEVRIDVRDAMGANAATETGHRAGALLMMATLDRLPMAVICGNDVPERRVTARAVWRAEELGADLAQRPRPSSAGPADARELARAGIERVLDLQAWAEADPARAVTHMKGVMNGVTAVALATGQDTRALEAVVWTQACRSGACRPLTEYTLTASGDLYGKLTIPVVGGTVGGATRHPMAVLARRIGGIDGGRRLAETMAAVGLAQNFAALWSLAHEGIIASHDKLGRTKT